ncbi:hypothetical protein L6R52_19770 [Myxococcota bacterium]|nr:hypothetical protein [Myxococcota bacterium]
MSSRIRSLRPLALVGLVTLGLAACNDSAPQASGVLSRPAGLAHLARTSSTAASPRRATLFIADSEIQGVRVAELTQTVESDGSTSDTFRLVPGPVVYFPLVIPAAGFPTELVTNTSGDRLYVLSPASKTLHVLDVSDPASASGTTYVPIDEIPLGAYAPAWATPTALAVVGGAGASTDFVAVAFDAAGEGDSVLVGLTLSSDGTRVSPVSTASVAIGHGPRELLVRDGAVLASSALSRTVSIVATATADDVLTFSSVTPVDVGGPTSELVAYGDDGIFAFRVDRPSVVFLEPMGATWVRSSRSFDSPYATTAERGSEEMMGLLQLRPSPAVSAAYGVLPNALVSIDGDSSISLDEVAERGRVMAIVHVDGEVSFVSGSPPALRRNGPVGVTSLQRDAPGLSLTSVTCDEPQACTTSVTDPDCGAGLVTESLAEVFPQTIRVSYQGALAGSRSGTLTLTASSTAGAALTLADASVSSFSERLVRPGDHVLVELSMRPGCDELAPIVSTSTTVTVTATAADALVLAPVALDALAGCPEGVLPAARFDYEVYAAGEELVVARIDGVTVDHVFARAPIVDGVASLSGAINAEISAPGPLACTVSSGGAVCTDNAECGSGQTCNETGGQCFLRCTCTSSACETDLVRICPSLRVGVRGVGGATVVLRPTSASTRPAAPDEIVFSPLRRSFFVSEPGARQVAELVSIPSQVFAIRFIR